MTKFFIKFKKPCFWHIFGPFSQILRQKKKFSRKFGSAIHNFTFQMIQFQENGLADGRMEGWTELILQDPFDCCQRSKKYLSYPDTFSKITIYLQQT